MALALKPITVMPHIYLLRRDMRYGGVTQPTLSAKKTVTSGFRAVVVGIMVWWSVAELGNRAIQRKCWSVTLSVAATVA